MKTRNVLVSTAASFALLASTVVATGNAQPLSHLLHLHPGDLSQADNRVSLRLYNDGSLFKELSVDGKNYTLMTHQTLDIKAPAGTAVYAASNMALHHRGDIVLTVEPTMQNARIVLQ